MSPTATTPTATTPAATTPAATTPAATTIAGDPVVPSPIDGTPFAPSLGAASHRTVTSDQRKGSAGLSHGVLGRLRADQRGEGVISAAIAVLIMAFVGVAAFVAYRGIMSSVTAKTTECVDVYVSNGSGCE